MCSISEVSVTIKRIEQIRTGMPKGQYQEACLAMILGCTLDEVPPLWREGDGERMRDPFGSNWVEMLGFTIGQGRIRATFHFSDRYLPDDFISVLNQFHKPVADIIVRDGCILQGNNPAGYGHVVVWCDGRIIDPNPSQAGLEWFDGITVLPHLKHLMKVDEAWRNMNQLAANYVIRDGEWCEYRGKKDDDLIFSHSERVVEIYGDGFLKATHGQKCIVCGYEAQVVGLSEAAFCCPGHVHEFWAKVQNEVDRERTSKSGL